MAQGSVLYVIGQPHLNRDVLAAAQQFAIDQTLPLAVVYCLEQPEPEQQLMRLEKFETVESELRPYDIPFMTLLGARAKVLPWMGGHVKPVRIFTDDDVGEQNGKVQQHPIAWPGRVMDIAELMALIQSDSSYCLPD